MTNEHLPDRSQPEVPLLLPRGYEFEIHAKTRKEAIKIARGMVHREGHTRQEGGIKYKATKIS